MPLSQTISIPRPTAERSTARHERRLTPTTTSTARTVAKMKGMVALPSSWASRLGSRANAPEPVVTLLAPQNGLDYPPEMLLLHIRFVAADVDGTGPSAQPVVLRNHKVDDGGRSPAAVLPDNLRLRPG